MDEKKNKHKKDLSKNKTCLLMDGMPFINHH